MAIADLGVLKIDKMLTGYSQEQPQGDYVFNQLDAVVNVGSISDKIRIRSNDKFSQPDTLRTGKASSNNFDSTEGTNVQYFTEERALHEIITDRQIANTDAPVMLEQESALTLSSIISLGKDREVLTALGTASNTSAITHEFDDYTNSTPINDFNTGISAVYSNSKSLPTHIVMNVQTALALSRHPDILDLYKYTTSDSMIPMINLPKILFGMKVVIAGASYNNANLGNTESLNQILGDTMYFLHQEAPTRNSFSALKVFQYKNQTIKKGKVSDPSGIKILCSEDYDVKLLQDSAVYKMTNTIS